VSGGACQRQAVAVPDPTRPDHVTDEHTHPDHVADPLAASLARRASQVGEGGARAAVLGANDGLVTNLSLILGVAGAEASRSAVRLAGFASLVAGAFSMAAGEWVSVRAQVDLYRGVLARFRRHYVTSRPTVTHALVDRFLVHGVDIDTAATAASQIIGDDRRGAEVSTRLIVGLDPDELGSPWVAAVSSFLFFTLGAVVPLVPWFITEGGAAIVSSIVLGAVASVVAGAVIAVTSEEPWWRGALRQLCIVAGAAALTFAIGRVFGTTVA
jgi:VIT1/CCC1 family predicted Fe2+/Mn2+ transporter